MSRKWERPGRPSTPISCGAEASPVRVCGSASSRSVGARPRPTRTCPSPRIRPPPVLRPAHTPPAWPALSAAPSRRGAASATARRCALAAHAAALAANSRVAPRRRRTGALGRSTSVGAVTRAGFPVITTASMTTWSSPASARWSSRPATWAVAAVVTATLPAPAWPITSSLSAISTTPVRSVGRAIP